MFGIFKKEKMQGEKLLPAMLSPKEFKILLKNRSAIELMGTQVIAKEECIIVIFYNEVVGVFPVKEVDGVYTPVQAIQGRCVK